MMQSEFTDKAKTALVFAGKCARQMKQGYVGNRAYFGRTDQRADRCGRQSIGG